MNLFSTPWDILSPLLVFGFGLPVSISLGSQFGLTQQRSLFLYVWHTLWCIAYIVFTFTNGGDALYYYSQSLHKLPDFFVGTQFIIYFTYWFAGFLHLSYLSCFLVYNIIGFVGFIGFAAILQQLTYGQSNLLKRLAALVIFLPSISFWSSAIGKDAFAFSSAVLALWACLDLRRRIPVMVLAVLVMLLVRPHVAGFLVLALIVDSIFNRQLPHIRRIGLLLILLVAATWLLPLAIEYSGAGGIDTTEGASSYFEQRQSYNLDGSGGIDISGMLLPFQLFTFLLRPAFFDVNSLLSLFAAIDNSILLVVFSLAVLGLLQGRRIQSKVSIVFLLTYSSLAWIVFSITIANLGISIRQKWMFLPMLLYLAFSLAGRSRRLVILPTSS